MSLPADLRDTLTIPVISAPMFFVSSAKLAAAACVAGVGGSLARHNCGSIEEFESELQFISEACRRASDARESSRIGPLVVNLDTQMPFEEAQANLALIARHGGKIIITSVGNPTSISPMIRDHGMLHFHDVTSMRFVEKALQIGVDGMVAIGAGGGGHAGTISHLVFIPQIRSIFDGTIVMAGAVSHGSVVRAAEVLGADLAYMGTRFIATREAEVDDAYKAMLVEGTESDVVYSAGVNGMPASWLKASVRSLGLDPDAMPVLTRRGTDHLPPDRRPWRDIWSGGQGIGLIHDVPSVAELVGRLTEEYDRACAVPRHRTASKSPAC